MAVSQKRFAFVTFLVAAVSILSACSDPIIGKWRSREDDKRIEFLGDGTFVASSGFAGNWHAAQDDYLLTASGLGVPLNQRLEIEGDAIIMHEGNDIQCLFRYFEHADGTRSTTQVTSAFGNHRCSLN